jgi:hypothetical protein
MRGKPWRRLGWGVALALLMLGLALPLARAAGPPSALRDRFRGGDTVLVPANETVPHDLYVAGGSVRIEGRIEGDLFVGGGTVDVSGPVTGDVFIGGGTVTVTGPVGRHLRVAGGNVTVGGPVQLDLMAASGALVIRSGARVGGDLIFSAGQMNLDGTVAGGVLGSAQAYTKTGSIAGSEEVTITPSQPEPRQRQAPTTARRILDQVRRYAAIVLLGALLLLVPPRLVQAGATRLRERPLPSLGFGALGFVGFFAVLLGLLIGMFVLAIPLGILGLGGLVATVVLGVLLGSAVLSYAFFVVLAFVAAAVVGLLIGQLVLQRLNPAGAANQYVALLLGVLVVVVLTAIPVVGGLLGAVVALLGLGALVLRFWPWRGAPAGAGVATPVQGTPANSTP